MCTTLPPVLVTLWHREGHPCLRDFEVFHAAPPPLLDSERMNPYIRLDGVSTKPVTGAEFHRVLMDTAYRRVADEKGRQTLNCIRLLACLKRLPRLTSDRRTRLQLRLPGPIGAT